MRIWIRETAWFNYLLSNSKSKTNALQYNLPHEPWIGPFGHKSCVNKSRWEFVLENIFVYLCEHIRRVNEVERRKTTLHSYVVEQWKCRRWDDRYWCWSSEWLNAEKVHIAWQRLISPWESDAHIVMKCCEKAFQCHFVYHISQQCRTGYTHVGRPGGRSHRIAPYGQRPYCKYLRIHIRTAYAKCLQINGDAMPDNGRAEQNRRKKTTKNDVCRRPIFSLLALSLCTIFMAEHTKVQTGALRCELDITSAQNDP